jgi:hypothetical protein
VTCVAGGAQQQQHRSAIEHSVEVTAETLYEAVAAAVAALQKDDW